MKTCPVCSAKAFDDARICYGCMHSFEAEAQRKKEPSPLDNTTLEWLAPENLRPLTASCDDGWISGNDAPPWIESYKEDMDMAEAACGSEEVLCCPVLPSEGIHEGKQLPNTSSSSDDEAYYEVPLEVYAESWSGNAWDLSPNVIAWAQDCGGDSPSDLSVKAHCSVTNPQDQPKRSFAQEVLVRLEFGWADRAAAVPVRVESRQDWLSKTPVGALAASC